MGDLVAVGKAHVQSDIDCHSRYARGRLYVGKLSLTVERLRKDTAGRTPAPPVNR